MTLPTHLALYIIAGLGCVFLIMGLIQSKREDRRISAKTYIRTGLIFLAVSAINLLVLA